MRDSCEPSGSRDSTFCGARKATPSLARGRLDRHDPYHALLAATGGSPRQEFRLVSAGLATATSASGCHRLQPRGSVKAPPPVVITSVPEPARSPHGAELLFLARVFEPRLVPLGRGRVAVQEVHF